MLSLSDSNQADMVLKHLTLPQDIYNENSFQLSNSYSPELALYQN